jgi:hypothetical protein
VLNSHSLALVEYFFSRLERKRTGRRASDPRGKEGTRNVSNKIDLSRLDIIQAAL